MFLSLTINNKKYIYVNAFRVISEVHLNSKFGLWETEPVDVRDGGNSYWNVFFDLEMQEFVRLAFHGSA